MFKLRKEKSPDSQHRNRRTGEQENGSLTDPETFNPFSRRLVLTQFVCRLDCSCSVECVQWTESSGAGPPQDIVYIYSRASQEYLHFLYFTLPLLYILETDIGLFTPLHLFELKILYRSLCLWLNSDRRTDRCCFVVIYETEVVVLWC